MVFLELILNAGIIFDKKCTPRNVDWDNLISLNVSFTLKLEVGTWNQVYMVV